MKTYEEILANQEIANKNPKIQKLKGLATKPELRELFHKEYDKLDEDEKLALIQIIVDELLVDDDGDNTNDNAELLSLLREDKFKDIQKQLLEMVKWNGF